MDAAWVTLAWSGLDYVVEWVAWNKRMKMTKQQQKDEMKEAMGNPQVKGRIRQVQNAMRRRKVKADISKASVVITNPTHYAVALEFSFETMQAPKVLAKGSDLHAAAIREEARWAGRADDRKPATGAEFVQEPSSRGSRFRLSCMRRWREFWLTCIGRRWKRRFGEERMRGKR